MAIDPYGKFMVWIDTHIVNPLSFGRPLPRLIGITILNRSKNDRTDYYWNILQIAMPGKADALWQNGLISCYVHLPFGISISIRLPVPYGGSFFGWTLQVAFGWKGYNGQLMGICRIQNDDHGDYHQPDKIPNVGRARGLDEGNV